MFHQHRRDHLSFYVPVRNADSFWGPNEIELDDWCVLMGEERSPSWPDPDAPEARPSLSQQSRWRAWVYERDFLGQPEIAWLRENGVEFTHDFRDQWNGPGYWVASRITIPKMRHARLFMLACGEEQMPEDPDFKWPYAS
jgi:hypothetical protein